MERVMKARHFAIAATFTWIGFFSAISFMEAWIKFTAPGVTLTIGLAIGQLVFGALNKVEIALAATIVVALVLDDPKMLLDFFLITALVVLAVETFYLLPQLSHRIDTWLRGETPGRSYLHNIYIGAEVVKAIALLTYGFKKIKS